MKPLVKASDLFPQRDLSLYPNPQDEPLEEKAKRLGIRLPNPGESMLEWGQSGPFGEPAQAPVPSPEPKREPTQSAQPVQPAQTDDSRAVKVAQGLCYLALAALAGFFLWHQEERVIRILGSLALLAGGWLAAVKGFRVMLG